MSLLGSIGGGLLSKVSGLLGGLLGKALPFVNKIPFVGNMMGSYLKKGGGAIPDLVNQAGNYLGERAMEYG